MSSLLNFLVPSNETEMIILSQGRCKHMVGDVSNRVGVAPGAPESGPSAVGRFILISPTLQTLAAQQTILKTASTLMDNDHCFTKQALIPLITQELGVSLRALDWLVTNYSKKYRLCIGGVNVHNGYKEMLSIYRRRHFDPFQRCIDAPNVGKVSFVHQDRTYESTVGQINFIMWCYQTKIINYIVDHINEIETDMNTCLSSRHKQISSSNKRTELSRAPTFKCSITPVKGTVK